MDNKKLHFTVLLVPSDNKRVREFHLTYTLAALVPVLFAIIVLSVVYYCANANEKSAVLEAENKVATEAAQTAENENILLKAEMEELKSLLNEANLALEQKNTAEAENSEKNTKKSIPDAFPVAGGVGVPTVYSEETPFIQFTVGEKTRIVATADGTVSKITDTLDGASEIKVDHGNGYISTYTCKGTLIVSEGDSVIRSSTLILAESEEVLPDSNLVLTYQLEFNGISIDPMSMIEING